MQIELYRLFVFYYFILRFTRGLHEAVFCPKRRITRVDKKSLQNLHKVLDLCGFYGYYMSRYSGIVQSVEQRTVNPYVTGSSPVARAKEFRRKPRRFAAFFFT